MPVEILLDQLHKVRKSGRDSWMACCPAHDDKTPSLRVTDASGHILIHCFAGCEPYDILAAVGLSMTDLFPERDAHSFDDQPPAQAPRETRSESQMAEIQIRLLTTEAMMENGYRLTPEEKTQASNDYKFLKARGAVL